LVDDPETSLLAWTTTPWTLPSNLAICGHPDYVYIKIHDEARKRNFIILESLLTTLYKDPKKAKFKKLATYKGTEMKGWKYVPLYDYFKQQYESKAFIVLNDTYVKNDSGTGLVHQAPAFGEDDHRIAIENGIIQPEDLPPCPVDDAGRFTKEVPEYTGVYIRVGVISSLRCSIC
jgi:isoleucyl-tRNA synthetase